MATISPRPGDVPAEPAPEAPRIRDLVAAVQVDAQRLVKAHIELARAELKSSGAAAAKTTVLFVVAGVVALFAVGFLLTTLAWVLAVWLPTWAGFGIVTLLLLLLVGLLLLMGRGAAKKITGPEHTSHQLDLTKRALSGDIDVTGAPGAGTGAHAAGRAG